jgi:predicted histone-like DNA-binding protein
MSITLKKLERPNPRNPEQPKKWYFTQLSKGHVDTDQICQDILEISSLSPGDIRSVIENLKLVIQKRLDSGYSVRLEKFGSFRASVTSEGADTSQELVANKVRSVRLVFVPAPQLKERLSKTRLEIVS